MDEAVALQMCTKICRTAPGTNPPEHGYPSRRDVGERRCDRAIHCVGDQASTKDAIEQRFGHSRHDPDEIVSFVELGPGAATVARPERDHVGFECRHHCRRGQILDYRIHLPILLPLSCPCISYPSGLSHESIRAMDPVRRTAGYTAPWLPHKDSGYRIGWAL